jgi:hypothetical protein
MLVETRTPADLAAHVAVGTSLAAILAYVPITRRPQLTWPDSGAGRAVGDRRGSARCACHQLVLRSCATAPRPV